MTCSFCEQDGLSYWPEAQNSVNNVFIFKHYASMSVLPFPTAMQTFSLSFSFRANFLTFSSLEKFTNLLPTTLACTPGPVR